MDILQLYIFFAGKASKKQKLAIKQWAESSSENYDALYREKKMYDAGILLADEALLSNQGKKTMMLRIINYAVRIVAVVLLVITGVTISEYQSLVRDSYLMQTINVPAGQRINLILADSTSVWLNSNTKFSYPTVFTGNQRKVELDGEAYFEVSPDKERAFSVHTSKGDVRVLGTHFNLEAYSNTDVLKTSLFEGKVQVRLKGNNIYLKPDQMLLSYESGKIYLKDIDDYDQFRWREGLICIKSAKFKDIMKLFTKYFGDSIVIDNKKVQNYKYTGKFRQSRGVINALRLLQKDAPFVIEQDEERQVIYIK